MKAGNFNINDYLDKLYEEAEQKEPTKTGFMDGGEGTINADGIVIPDTNKKSYDWLKKEFDKGKVEVKVEMNIGGAKFEPGYDLQTNLDSVKDFKPGMFGEVKTVDSKGGKGEQGEQGDKKPSLDAKKDKPAFQKGEGDAQKKELPKTKSSDVNIKNKEQDEEKEEKEEGQEKEGEEKEEKDEKPEEKEGQTDEPKIKKIDLKTKKK